ncbi:hypothetical protein BDF22DRAFT_512533 [Syncephalis plumigaleata]|nr:hypothetical protein BDF22DRAFT_512533 [Syncephalis plumigaleata]
MKQQTQHGNIELLEDGRVKLAVRGESRIMLISGDGNTIELIEEGSRPAVVAKYKLDDLPEQYHRKYAYASRFVELVRSRTPKITYFSSEAQCSLMENGPNADFEVKFYDGWKIQYSARRKELEVTEPVPTHASSSSSPSSGRQRSTPITHRFDPERDLLDLAPPIATRFQHARDILARCLDAERQSSSYPVVIRRRANSNTAPILSSRSPSVTFYDNDLYQNNVETKPAKATPASTSNTTQNTRIEKPYLYTAFLSHVGWLVRFVHGDLALFVDGTQLRTKHTQQMIYWRESSHATEEW